MQRRSARNDRLVVPVALSCHCEEPDRRVGDEAIQPFNSGFPSFGIKSNYCRIAVRLPRQSLFHSFPLLSSFASARNDRLVVPVALFLSLRGTGPKGR